MSLQYEYGAPQFCPIPRNDHGLARYNPQLRLPLLKEKSVPADDPRINDNTRAQPGLVGKALTLLITIALLVLGFMFSVLLVAFAAGVALLAWGYLWWKTRALRRHLREQAADGMGRQEAPAGGSVFEGEAVRVDGANAERTPEASPPDQPEQSDRAPEKPAAGNDR